VRAVDNLALLEVDYLLAAKVSLMCRRPFMAVLFVELWAGQLMCSRSLKACRFDKKLTPLEEYTKQQRERVWATAALIL